MMAGANALVSFRRKVGTKEQKNTHASPKSRLTRLSPTMKRYNSSIVKDKEHVRRMIEAGYSSQTPGKVDQYASLLEEFAEPRTEFVSLFQ
jgi:hypothetical protein